MGAVCCKGEQRKVLEEEILYTRLVQDQKGRDFADSYEVVKVIGVGSISKISLITPKKQMDDSRRPSNANFYALKEIDMSIVEKHLIEELENELKLLKALDHPNIIKVYETFELKNRKAIVMELCSGGDLYKRHPYSEKQAAKIVKECLSAISYLHSHNVIHRDVKYENIMFESDAPNAQVKLIDFGLSKSFLRKNDVMTERVGTLYTMSPQVLQGVYTAQADLWSLGIVAFMLLSGSDPPFQGRTPEETVSKVIRAKVEFKGKIWHTRSAESKEFISSLLKVDPQLRLTAVEALKNPWLSKEINLSDTKPNPELVSDVAKNLVNYAACNDLKKVALNIIAKRSNADEIFELRKVFGDYDRENTGSISLQEFMEALGESGYYTAEEMKTIFNEVDVNHNGIIMYTEFLAAALETQGRIAERRIVEAFDVLDEDHSGFISAMNLRKILGPDCSDDYIAGIIKSADSNGDGQIDYGEFKDQFEKQYNDKVKEIYRRAPSSFVPEEPLLGLDTVIPGGIASIRESGSFNVGVQVRDVGTGH